MAAVQRPAGGAGLELRLVETGRETARVIDFRKATRHRPYLQVVARPWAKGEPTSSTVGRLVSGGMGEDVASYLLHLRAARPRPCFVAKQIATAGVRLPAVCLVQDAAQGGPASPCAGGPAEAALPEITAASAAAWPACERATCNPCSNDILSGSRVPTLLEDSRSPAEPLTLPLPCNAFAAAASMPCASLGEAELNAHASMKDGRAELTLPLSANEVYRGLEEGEALRELIREAGPGLNSRASQPELR